MTYVLYFLAEKPCQRASVVEYPMQEVCAFFAALTKMGIESQPVRRRVENLEMCVNSEEVVVKNRNSEQGIQITAGRDQVWRDNKVTIHNGNSGSGEKKLKRRICQR